jgi:hypothetical protein
MHIRRRQDLPSDFVRAASSVSTVETITIGTWKDWTPAGWPVQHACVVMEHLRVLDFTLEAIEPNAKASHLQPPHFEHPSCEKEQRFGV